MVGDRVVRTSRRAASLLVVIGAVLLALSLVRITSPTAQGEWDFVDDCGSVVQPRLPVALNLDDSRDDIVNGTAFLNDIIDTCTAAYADRAVEALMEAAVGGVLFGAGTTVLVRRRQQDQDRRHAR